MQSNAVARLGAKRFARAEPASGRGALDAWRSAQEIAAEDATYISRFASMARTLTHPEEIFRALNDQPVSEL